MLPLPGLFWSNICCPYLEFTVLWMCTTAWNLFMLNIVDLERLPVCVVSFFFCPFCFFGMNQIIMSVRHLSKPQTIKQYCYFSMLQCDLLAPYIFLINHKILKETIRTGWKCVQFQLSFNNETKIGVLYCICSYLFSLPALYTYLDHE